MSWLADRTGIHLNLRPLAPIAGAIAGNLLLPGIGGAALGSAFGRFADDKAHGAGWGESLKHGAITGAATYAGGKSLEALRGAFAPSSAAGANIGQAGGAVQAPGAYSGITDAASGAGDELAGGWEGYQPGAVGSSAGGNSLKDAFTGGLKAAGSAAKANPMAVSMGLQGLGQMSSAGAQNDLARAQAHRLETQGQADDYELETRKRRDAALEPLRQALAGQLAGFRANQYGIAANPYAGRS